MDKTVEKKLNDLLDSGDITSFLVTLGEVVKSGNVSKISREVEMTRGGIYHALSEKGNPTFSALVKITKALGLKINFFKA